MVLMLLFRSARVGLMSLLPNAIPLAVGVGFMRLAGLRLEPVTVMVYSIALRQNLYLARDSSMARPL